MFYSPVITNAAEAADNKKLHLFRYVEDPEQYKLAAYERHGGYRAWRKVLAGMKPDEVIEVVKKSGLRGRGGAGFPTGMKWGFIPKDSPKPRYLCCNADESEPGTCKDRVLMERDPHAIIEGMAIAAYAIGCHIMFIYIRGEFGHPIARMEAAMKEAYAAGHLGRNIHGSGYDLDDLVAVPWTTAQKKIRGRYSTWLDDVLCSAATMEDVDHAVADVRSLLRQRHGIGPGDEEDFNIRRPDEVIKAQIEASQTLERLLIALASISLLVGGIGIMNIMLASVTARTNEI
ncbi:MAG TPA: hypothetical protein PK112_02410, partial [candidate division Zixibacteria bacterium]|nr:hypothetical protein [candidate division Zixibacteria bacterium]